MGAIGIVNNPLALRNRRSPALADRLRALLGAEGEVADAASDEELLRVAERFRARGVELLGVNGGDGTGQRVLTALAAAYGGTTLPPVALLCAGALNSVAASLSIRGSPESILKTALDRRRAGALPVAERDALVVEADDAPPRLGFLFGTGLAVALLEAYGRGRPGRLSAAWLAARATISVLAGGPLATQLGERQALRVSVDGDEWPDEPFLCLLAGSIPRIWPGFRPLSRCDEQPGFFHTVGVTGSSRLLVAHLPSIWMGRPWKRSLAVDAVARELTIEGPVRFAVDGELYAARHAVRVRTGPIVRLFVP